MTEAAKEIMGVETISVVADKGYYDATDISNCEQSGTTCYVAVVDSYSHVPDKRYDKKNFRYDAANDRYICPEGIALSLVKTRRADSEIVRKEYRNAKDCKCCPNRAKCTKAKEAG
ncbi:MAG: transposase [Clostridiales bacterium]|jgi:hypothetical protein|nr:transposase [Clostridiales bacterium]